MTTNSNSNSKVTLASLFPLVRLLKTRVAVYAPESDHDLGQLLLSVDPKALGGKMKLLALVCKELGREKPLKLLETRKAEKVAPFAVQLFDCL